MMFPVTVLIQCAMQAEADPLIAALGLVPVAAPWSAGLPMRCWSHPTEPIALVASGTDWRTGVDLIGTTPATLATQVAVAALQPRVLLVAGTAGGHSQRTAIGRVHLVERAYYHDRRIPLPGFDAYGIGPEPLHHSDELAEAFAASRVTLSTGNALDTLPQELAFFERHQVTVKDMETAAIAWTASFTQTPVVAVRAVTDFFDHPTPEHQFLSNFGFALQGLTESVVRGMPALLQKS